MKDTNVVTKLSKMDISRIALCRNPADQDGNFVIVKSEDGAPEVTEAVDETVEKQSEETPSEPEVVVEKETETVAGEAPVISPEVAEFIQKAIADGIRVAMEKSPVLAGQPMVEDVEDGSVERVAIQACVKELVDECNAFKILPKAVRKRVAHIAKYHGVEGPSDEDGEDGSAFSEVTAELRTVVDILKGLTIALANKPEPSPAAAAPAAPAPAAKPAPAKKSISDERAEMLEKSFEKAKFVLLQAMGKDPTPLQ